MFRMNERDELEGGLEDILQDPRAMDFGLGMLKELEGNAPLHPPDRARFLRAGAEYIGKEILRMRENFSPLNRREFFKWLGGSVVRHSPAILKYGTLLGALNLISCSPMAAQFQGKAHPGWELYLMQQDWIRGPRLLIHPRTGMPSDFEHHIKQGWSGGFGAVDYDVPIGTPIVPTADAFRTRTKYDRTGGNELFLVHRYKPRKPIVSWYVHLDKYADIISHGKLITTVGGAEIRDHELGKLRIVAFSGNSGVGPGGGAQPPHLHFQVSEVEGGQIGQGQPMAPGLNPFELGIDADKPFGGVDEYKIPYGGRPVYWDGKTEIPLNLNQRKRLLQKYLDTLDSRVRERDLDKETRDELLKRHNNTEALRDYLGMLVLTKHTGKDGKPNYRHLPGSLPYDLMLEIFSRTSNQEFIAMLPFISPFVKEAYQKANPPDVKF